MLRKNRKATILLVALISILIISIGATVAYIALKTDELTNEFVPAAVTCQVEEQFSNGVKSDVCIKNTGNISAYIRTALIINWVNDQDGSVLSTSPTEGTDYTLVLNNEGWDKGSDGYYYYTRAVSAGSKTTPLITKAEAINQPEGYSLSIHVLASAIQSEPSKAIQEVWNVTIYGDMLAPH